MLKQKLFFLPVTFLFSSYSMQVPSEQNNQETLLKFAHDEFVKKYGNEFGFSTNNLSFRVTVSPKIPRKGKKVKHIIIQCQKNLEFEQDFTDTVRPTFIKFKELLHESTIVSKEYKDPITNISYIKIDGEIEDQTETSPKNDFKDRLSKLIAHQAQQQKK
jgi:hypothetical protein